MFKPSKLKKASLNQISTEDR